MSEKPDTIEKLKYMAAWGKEAIQIHPYSSTWCISTERIAALDHAISCCEKVETIKGFCEIQVEMCDRPGYEKAQHLCRLILEMINDSEVKE
jgi:hypothetical protein